MAASIKKLASLHLLFSCMDHMENTSPMQGPNKDTEAEYQFR